VAPAVKLNGASPGAPAVKLNGASLLAPAVKLNGANPGAPAVTLRFSAFFRHGVLMYFLGFSK
jgi:hypothetical protein